jgi:hypothetical protein
LAYDGLGIFPSPLVFSGFNESWRPRYRQERDRRKLADDRDRQHPRGGMSR